MRARLNPILDEPHVVGFGCHGARVVAVVDIDVSECGGYDEGGVAHVFGEVGDAVYPCQFCPSRE